MNNKSTDIQVWFLRHGKTNFDYDTSSYENFIEMLCNGNDKRLQKEHGINLKALPGRVEFVAHSPARRAVDTAKVLRKELGVKLTKELDLLHEVKFDRSIVHKQEFKSLAESRKDILERWYHGRNKSETFEDSLARVRAIEAFLSKRREKTIILVTHGWFLRLLEIYFVQGKRTNITFEDILKVNPVPLGDYIKATIDRKYQVESHMSLAGGDILISPMTAQAGGLATENTNGDTYYLGPTPS